MKVGPHVIPVIEQCKISDESVNQLVNHAQRKLTQTKVKLITKSCYFLGFFSSFSYI